MNVIGFIAVLIIGRILTAAVCQLVEGMSEKYKVLSLFAGIGGICNAFQDAGCIISMANEIDKYACMTYRYNHPDRNLIEGDVCNLHGKDIPKVDIIAGGFPCQPFSQAGNQRGFDDERGLMFFQIMRILDELIELNKKPKALFFENVSRLSTIEGGSTLDCILAEIRKREYCVTCNLMNSKDYSGIPQNRNRIYIVAFESKKAYDNFSFPEPIPCKPLSSVINIHEKKDQSYYCDSAHNIRYDYFQESIKKKGVIYQYRRYYMRENKSSMCPALTANMGDGGHNVPLIRDDYDIRELTIQECLTLQGFENFKIPVMAKGHLYKQIGNSVTVPVVKSIAVNIVKALNGHFV